MKKFLLSLIAILAMTIGYAQTFEWNSQPANTPYPKEVQPASGSLEAYEKAYNERQSGMAGIYNPNVTGSRTVYGETYAPTELTASHGILPLGTLIRVVNLDNNRNVTVRVNDRGQECSGCLVMLSQAAADQLGINYRGRVSVERVGFSNWNPAPPVVVSGVPAPVNYQNTPAAGGQPGVVRPVMIEGEAYGWQSKGNTDHVPAGYGAPAPAAYGAPTTVQAPQPYQRAPAAYGTAATSDNYAVMSAPKPSVISREVTPAPVANEPVVTYSRRPATVVPQPATMPNQVVTPSQTTPTQAAPPPSTVVRYQENRTYPAPATYQTPAPMPYGTVARGAVTPAAASSPAAAAPMVGFVVQLGAYNNELYAKNRVNQLINAGIANVFYRSVTKPDGQVINRVYAGTYTTMAEAQRASNDIRQQHQIAGIVTSM